MTIEDFKSRLTPQQVSDITGLSVGTLAVLRMQKNNSSNNYIPFFKVGKRVFYRKIDVYNFITNIKKYEKKSK